MAWNYYVTSNQLLTELHGLTRAYPFNGDIVHDAHVQVRHDPASNRSWNLAWLVLTKIKEEYVDISIYSNSPPRSPAVHSIFCLRFYSPGLTPWSGVPSPNRNLIPGYAALEANKPEMWGGRDPSPEEAQQLRMLFEEHWTGAVDRMLRHWTNPPTWY